MSETIEEKQQYLAQEIIEQHYDGQEFNDFMCSIRGEESIDLEKWSLEDLQSIVQQFKSQHQQKEQENQQQEENNTQTENNPQQQQQQNAEIQNAEEQPKLETKTSFENSEFPKEFNEPFFLNMKTGKLESNPITDQKDLFITITNPVKVKEGIFQMAYFQYDVTIKALGQKVVRKLSDFIFLSEALPLFNNITYIPPLPHFEFGLKDDSGKKMLYLQNYLNALVENKYFRTLPIFHEFLTIPQVTWNNKRKEYEKMKTALALNNIPTLEGEINININKEEDSKAIKIKEEINKKTEAFDVFNTTVDKILECFEILKYQFEMLSKCLLDLEKAYSNNIDLKGFFDRLNLLSKKWSRDYLKQYVVFRDEIKYFFKFLNKDNVSFLKKFEEFRTSRDDYKNKFEKIKKLQVKPPKDVELIKKLRMNYGIQLLMVNQEYYYLLERQAYRCLTQFMKYQQQEKSILQSYENCKILFDINQNPENLTENEE